MLTKHANGKHPGSKAFPEAKGKPDDINLQAEGVLENILNDPDKSVKMRPGKSGVQLLQVHKPGGAGVIFKWQNDKWEFSYFTENLE